MFKYPNFATSPDKFPKTDHLAIIVFSHLIIPGDERSRTCPGHGYPEHTEPTISYNWYDLADRQHWLDRLTELEKDRKSYVALDRGKRVTVKLSSVISAE